MLDIGVRYDLVTGFAFDQDENILYSELRAAAKAGVFNSSGLPCPCIGFEDFGKDPAEDKNNIAPRVGFTYDVKGDGDMRAARRRRPLLRLRLHQREHPVRGDRRPVVVRHRSTRTPTARASATPTAASSRSASRCRPTSSRT